MRFHKPGQDTDALENILPVDTQALREKIKRLYSFLHKTASEHSESNVEIPFYSTPDDADTWEIFKFFADHRDLYPDNVTLYFPNLDQAKIEDYLSQSKQHNI